MPFLALPFRADNKGPVYCPAADENMSRQPRLDQNSDIGGAPGEIYEYNQDKAQALMRLPCYKLRDSEACQ